VSEISDQRAKLAEVLLREASAALELSHSDICKSLQDALSDMFPGQWCYIRDVFGDDESGDVVYCCGQDTYKAQYEIGLANGKRTTSIDTATAVNVLPRTVYDEEADEYDHYADMSGDDDDDDDGDDDMTESNRIERFPGSANWKHRPLRERFISKDERDAADASDFAGKGKSFPILKPSDVMAAVHSMGRAGSDNKSTDALKASIIRIAKRKGWTKYLPKAWQNGNGSESHRPAAVAGQVKLAEGVATLDPIVLKEARADYEIKLIAPGKGSSAFYPTEVLKRDGPKVFTPGTHVYLNHPTQAEEAARPEGDVKNLAGVLTTGAKYEESHAKGPGLYARMKVFADHAQMVEEKAAHVGMSIRASGIAESGKTKDGLPVLKELTSAESVDVVTRAGAGGMILTESAHSAGILEGDMTPDEVKKLVESAVKEAVAEANKPVAELRQRALRGDAREEAERLLEAVTLPNEAKRKIVAESLREIPLTEAGAIDLKKFGESVAELAKTEGAYLAKITGSGKVVGMGLARVGESGELSKEERKKLKEAKRAAKEERRDSVDVFESLGMPRDAAKLAVRRDVA